MRTSVYIRPTVLSDQKDFVAAVRDSKALHHPWIGAPNTPVKFRAYVRRMAPPANGAFLVCRRDTLALVGVINLTNVVRGVFQSGYLGYYAFAGNERQGLMREGLQAFVRHAFKSLKLHRLEANIQPGNARSIALVSSCGFQKEGYSPRYLKVGGRWRDHERLDHPGFLSGQNAPNTMRSRPRGHVGSKSCRSPGPASWLGGHQAGRLEHRFVCEHTGPIVARGFRFPLMWEPEHERTRAYTWVKSRIRVTYSAEICLEK